MQDLLQRLFDWLTALPTAALYAALAVTAAIENIFPPFPADVVVAFGSFTAARGNGTAVGSFLATWGGNIVGAMIMYYAGRRFGADRLSRLMMQRGGHAAEQRLAGLYGKHGVWALVLSRFLPAVRALVPPVAGALRIPAGRALAAMAAASGVWYAGITYLAFRVGDDWEQLRAAIGRGQRWVGIAALAIAALAVLIWLVRRRRRR